MEGWKALRAKSTSWCARHIVVFKTAKLKKVNMVEADLEEAFLMETDLEEANFNKASLI
jgi:uncharacterized protein YjbI with pentapeptide repeats